MRQVKIISMILVITLMIGLFADVEVEAKKVGMKNEQNTVVKNTMIENESVIIEQSAAAPEMVEETIGEISIADQIVTEPEMSGQVTTETSMANQVTSMYGTKEQTTEEIATTEQSTGESEISEQVTTPICEEKTTVGEPEYTTREWLTTAASGCTTASHTTTVSECTTVCHTTTAEETTKKLNGEPEELPFPTIRLDPDNISNGTTTNKNMSNISATKSYNDKKPVMLNYDFCIDKTGKARVMVLSEAYYKKTCQAKISLKIQRKNGRKWKKYKKFKVTKKGNIVFLNKKLKIKKSGTYRMKVCIKFYRKKKRIQEYNITSKVQKYKRKQVKT